MGAIGEPDADPNLVLSILSRSLAPASTYIRIHGFSSAISAVLRMLLTVQCCSRRLARGALAVAGRFTVNFGNVNPFDLF